MGNLRHPITQTPLPGAKKAYGQLLSRDFNPLDIPPITANSLAPFFLWTIGILIAITVANFAKQFFLKNKKIKGV